MRTLFATLLLLATVAGAAQAQMAPKQNVAPGTSGQHTGYPDWAQRAFEPKD